MKDSNDKNSNELKSMKLCLETCIFANLYILVNIKIIVFGYKTKNKHVKCIIIKHFTV